MKQWIRILKNGSILLFLITFLTVSSVHAEQILINVTEEGGSQEVTVGTSGNFQVPETIIREETTIPVQSVIYESEDPEILSVDENGTFHAFMPGETSVSISVYGTWEQTSNNSDNTYNDNYESYDDNDFYYGFHKYEDTNTSYDDFDSNDFYSDIFNNFDNQDSFYDTEESSNYLIFRTYYYFTVKPDLSQVTLKNTSQTIYLTNDWYEPKFTFELTSDIELNDDSSGITFSYEASNPDISIYGSLEHNIITLIMDKIGSTNVTITINERQFQVHIKAVLVSITRNSLLMHEKETKQLKVKGTKEKIHWSSSKPNIVSVSSSGKIKSKKKGNAVIKASIGDISVGCAVSVVSKNREKAIKTGIRIGKNNTYSQAHRMEKNYYDCSSLVWRAYSKNGNNFGNKGYAPVAADQGKWCARHKRLVKGGFSDKNIRKMKIHAGDLLFETGGNNKRYRGIYHVEMISGYICYGFTEKGKPILGITWVNRPIDYYPHMGQMVGRP